MESVVINIRIKPVFKEFSVTFRLTKAVFLLNIALMVLFTIFLTKRISFADTLTVKNWQITAEQIIEYKGLASVIAVGDVSLVELKTSKRIIEADWLSYDTIQQLIKIRGNIFLHNTPAGVTKTSVLDKVFISTVGSDQSIDLIKKKGFKSYQQSYDWLVTYEDSSSVKNELQAQPTSIVTRPTPQPVNQQPLVGTHTFSAEDWDIAADELLQLETPKTVIANGNVVLRKRRHTTEDDAATIYADWLSYDIELQTIKVRGNIHIEDSLVDSQDTVYNEIIIEDRDSANIAFSDDYATRNVLNNWLVAYGKDSTIRSSSQPASSPSKSTSTEEWDIDADRLIRYENPNSIVAIGNVILTKRERIAEQPQTPATSHTSQWDDLLGRATPPPETTILEAEERPTPKFKTTTKIFADWIAYDVDLEIIKAKGNVVIDNGKDKLFAQEGDVQINSETGRFENATLSQANKLHLEGKEISKTGFDTYHITDGWVITCKVEDGETPPWSISSSEADVRQGGYAVLKHAKFNVNGFPIFYTPYMVIPVKNTRQTGFLFPEISNSSDKGFGINTPFFWNISESTDLTLYPQYFAERGFMPGVEFRYVMDAESKGVVDASFLHDILDSDETDYNHTNSDRYWLRAKADHTFENGWVSRLDLDLVSDQDYLSEFDSGVTGFSNTHDRYLDTFGRGFTSKKDTSRDSTLNLMKSWNNTYLEIGFLAVNDVRINVNGDDIESDKPFWKLPNITYSGALPLEFAPAIFDWSTDYVNFWREDGYGGHRLDMLPSIGANLPISEYLESSVDVGIRNTYYSMENYGNPEDSSDKWTGDSSENRFLYDFELEVATTLEREFYSNSSDDYLEHIIRPYLRYNYLVDEDQEDLPYFDDKDRIDEDNGITYGFDTYLLSFVSDDEDNSSGRQYAYFEVEQTFYLSDLNKYNSAGDSYTYEDDLSDLSATLRWYPWISTFLEYKTEYNMYGEGFVSHNFTGQYFNTRGDSVGMEYSFQEEDIEQLNGFLNLKLTPEWSINFNFEHSLYDDETEEANVGITYTQPCWSVTVGSESTPEDTTFMITFNLANIGIPFGSGVTAK